MSNAFLHGILQEDVFMSQPPGFQDSNRPQHICHLKKSLYGLKQSSRAWFKRLHNFLLTLDFGEALFDSSLFIYNRGGVRVFLLVYVDDIVITTSSSSMAEKMISQLSKEFSVKDLGPLSFFLGIHATKSKDGVLLSQQQYASNLLSDKGLGNLKPTSTPMEPKIDLTQASGTTLNGDESHETTRYCRILGSLQYLTTTRPDIAFAVSKLSQFFTNPNSCQWQALQRVLRYVSGQPFLGLLLRPSTSTTVEVFSDADWAGDASDRRSHDG